MGDLKTNWTDPGAPIPGLGGAGVVSSGSDPSVDPGSGAGAIQSPWPADKHATSKVETAETPNSVSGLPALPNRFEPSGAPPEPPSLTDRNPGTIDRR